ncbi:MAG: DGQHR domain-containing protein [Pirellulaceae bacterium]
MATHQSKKKKAKKRRPTTRGEIADGKSNSPPKAVDSLTDVDQRGFNRALPTEYVLFGLVDTVLGVKVYRGYAPLHILAKLSRADIYDQKKNPKGTQRDLNVKHARDAYTYVSSKGMGFWPEIVLSCRDDSVLVIEEGNKNRASKISLDVKTLYLGKNVKISRVDGNHRLHFAAGDYYGFPPIDQLVSFCLATGLSRDQEISLFKDINNNQRKMNTSHLETIVANLTPEQLLMQTDLPLYVANQLGKDPESPFVDKVYKGGKKRSGSMIPLKTLKTGVEYMLSRTARVASIPDAHAKYKLIRNYWRAVKEWIPHAWEEPQKYLALRGAGLWALCFLAAEVCDRVIVKNQFSQADMLAVLRSGPDRDWSKSGEFEGLSGRGGAAKICEMIVRELADEHGITMSTLAQRIRDN